MYSYNVAGAKVGKRLRLSRDGLTWYYNPHPWSPPTTGTGIADLNSTYTYDNESRMTSVQYPSYSQSGATQPGPHLGYAYDTMGRLNTITDVAASSSIISGASYGPANELLTISGQITETRTYNSMLQLTSLSSSSSVTAVNLTYAYSGTQNNGKIASQTDNLSGEQVVYTSGEALGDDQRDREVYRVSARLGNRPRLRRESVSYARSGAVLNAGPVSGQHEREQSGKLESICVRPGVSRELGGPEW